jgi:hypothetical protein
MLMVSIAASKQVIMTCLGYIIFGSGTSIAATSLDLGAGEGHQANDISPTASRPDPASFDA